MITTRHDLDEDLWKQFGDEIEGKPNYGVALELQRVNNTF